MSAVAKRRLAALSEQLVSPIPDQGSFEDIPVLKKIAPESNGPRVKGKVVIVTGEHQLPKTIRGTCGDNPNLQGRIPLSALVARQHISSRRMVQELCTSATSTTPTSRHISASSHHYIPTSRCTRDSLMLQTRNR